MTKSPKPQLIIRTLKAGILKTELEKGRWRESTDKLIDIGIFSFIETDNVKFKDIEKDDELILKVVDRKGNKREFYYWVESVTTHFERDEKTGNDKINEIILQASSYPSILTKNTIEGTYEFKQGYGEIVKKNAKKFGFKVNNIKMTDKKGFISFKRMTLLESFRRMSYIEGWCLNFRDKCIIFGPCTPPKDSGVVITSKEMLKGTFTK